MEAVKVRKPRKKEASRSRPSESQVAPAPVEPLARDVATSSVRSADQPQSSSSAVAAVPAPEVHAPEQTNDIAQVEPEKEQTAVDQLSDAAECSAPPEIIDDEPAEPAPLVTSSVPQPLEAPVVPAHRTNVAIASLYPSVPSVDTSERPASAPFVPVPIYPLIEATSSGLPADRTMEKPPLEQTSSTAVVSAPPLYEDAVKTSWAVASPENRLMSDSELLHYFSSPPVQHRTANVEMFIKTEADRIGPLHPLLVRLQRAATGQTSDDSEESANRTKLDECVRQLWTVEQRSSEARDKCGCGKDASGAAHFQWATLSADRIDEMRNLLGDNRRLALEQRFTHEVEFGAVALQIQWIVERLKDEFRSECEISSSAHLYMIVLPISRPTTTRYALRAALADLFRALRQPALPPRFAQAAQGWAIELTSVLHTCALTADAEWLALHVLRLPSPFADWAAQLVQPHTSSLGPTRSRLDAALAVLAHLVAPIKARDGFLSRVAAFEAEDPAWTVLGEADETDVSLTTLSEDDLIAILDQLPSTEIYGLATRFFHENAGDRATQFVSVLAFHRLLTRLFLEGLASWPGANYLRFRQHLASWFSFTASQLCMEWQDASSELDERTRGRLLAELDAALLRALHALLAHNLSQFSVSLPWDAFSETARRRAEMLLRTHPVPDIEALLNASADALRVGESEALRRRLADVDQQTAVFVVNALGSLHANSSSDVTPFVGELVELCFIDDDWRDKLSRAGSEAVATLLERRPVALPALLTVIDRRMEDLGDYAANVLESASLPACRPSAALVGSLLGKWLIQRAPDHPANRIARRVLSSLHWGFDASGRPWLDAETHAAAADSVVKSHYAHCRASNGLIAKGVAKVAKLARRIPDHEQHFSQFCWSVLPRLKLDRKPTASFLFDSDLAAFFLYIEQTAACSPESFLGSGLSPWSELVNAGRLESAAVVLARLVHMHHAHIDRLVANRTFCETADRLLHSDQPYYVTQLLTDASNNTPVVQLLRSSIAFYSLSLSGAAGTSFLRAWTQLLVSLSSGAATASATGGFWFDSVVVRLCFDTIARIAFDRDPQELLGLVDIVRNAYTKCLATWKESSRGGFLALFKAEQPPPALIDKAAMEATPWTAYLFLFAETEAFSDFYKLFHEALAKKSKVKIDEATKKAALKTPLSLPPNRLAVPRWCDLVTAVGESAVLPLAIQQLALALYKAISVQNQRHHFADRYRKCDQCGPFIDAASKSLAERTNDDRGLCRAVSGWLINPRAYDVPLRATEQLNLDFLLQVAFAGNETLWLDFVDASRVRSEIDEGVKLYVSHTHSMRQSFTPPPPPSRRVPPSSSSRRTPPAPAAHRHLPPVPISDVSAVHDYDVLHAALKAHIQQIAATANHYTSSVDSVRRLDESYRDLLGSLYVPKSQLVPVTMRCGLRCAQPVSRQAAVTACERVGTVDQAISDNRQKRHAELTNLLTNGTPHAAVAVASIQHAARLVVQLAQQSRGGPAIASTARRFFYVTLERLERGEELLCPAALDAHADVLITIGKAFLANEPSEQERLMRIVLDGHVLGERLAKLFNPTCLEPATLLFLYKALSEALKQGGRAARAHALLNSMQMSETLAHVPAPQLSSLITLAFANLTAQPDPKEPLHQLCLSHVLDFAFFRFPLGLQHALSTILDGVERGVAPVHLLEMFVDRLGARRFDDPQPPCVDLAADEAARCLTALEARFAKLASRFYLHHARYIGELVRLVQIFVFIGAQRSACAIPPHAPVEQRTRAHVDAIECGLRVFSPLIAPVGSVPPFGHAQEPIASTVFERLADLLLALPLHASFPAILPDVAFVFLHSRLAAVGQDTLLYYALIERAWLRFGWTAWRPHSERLAQASNILTTRSPDAHPLIAAVLVRVGWKQVVIALQQHQLDDELRQLLAQLMDCIVGVLARPNTYAKVKASLTNLLKELCGADWLHWWMIRTQPELERIARAVGETLPSESCTQPNEPMSIFLLMWRKACHFSVRLPTDQHGRQIEFDASTAARQRQCILAQLKLLVRSSMAKDGVVLNAHYKQLVQECAAVCSQYADARLFVPVAGELISVWGAGNDVNAAQRDVMRSTLADWAKLTATSPLVLALLATTVESAPKHLSADALSLLEQLVTAYFSRPTSDWSECERWLSIPRSTDVHDRLFAPPSTSRNVTFLPLTMTAFCRLHHHQDRQVTTALVDYLCALKTKHVSPNEIGWCVTLCTAWRLALSEQPLPVDQVIALGKLHARMAAEETGGFLGIGRRSALSPRLQLICLLLANYIEQQQLAGDSSRLRLHADQAVVHSKVGAVRALVSDKAYSGLSAPLALALPYFENPAQHTVRQTAELCERLAQAVFPTNRVFKVSAQS